MKDWLIKKLGGYTLQEFLANRRAYDQLVTQMKQRRRFGAIIEGCANGLQVTGDILAAPGVILNCCYFEAVSPASVRGRPAGYRTASNPEKRS